jgi:hypothetical protein
MAVNNDLAIQRTKKLICTQPPRPSTHNNPISDTIATIDGFVKWNPAAAVKSAGTKAAFIASACKVANTCKVVKSPVDWIFVPLEAFSKWCSSTKALIDLAKSPGSYTATLDYVASWIRPTEADKASKLPSYIVVAKKVNMAAIHLLGMWVPVSIAASVLHAVKNAPYSKVASDLVGISSPVFSYLLLSFFGTSMIKNSIEAIYHRSKEQSELKGLSEGQNALNKLVSGENISEELTDKLLTSLDEVLLGSKLSRKERLQIILDSVLQYTLKDCGNSPSPTDINTVKTLFTKITTQGSKKEDFSEERLNLTENNRKLLDDALKNRSNKDSLTKALIYKTCIDWKAESKARKDVDVAKLSEQLEKVYTKLEGIVAHRYSKNIATVKAVGNAASLATHNYIVAVGTLAFGVAGRALAPRVTPFVLRTAAPVIIRCASAAPVMAKIAYATTALTTPALKLIGGITKDIEWMKSDSKPMPCIYAA